MPRSNLLWVRDAVTSDTDIGDTDVWLLDLLWKARSGDTHGSSAPLEPVQGFTPTPVHSDMRALAGVLPDQDIQGAKVLRIFFNYALYLAPFQPSIPTERTENLAAGHYHGISVQPLQFSSGILTSTGAVGKNPSQAEDSVAADWLMWERRYAASSTIRSYNWGVLPVIEFGYYGNVDTKNSRTISEWGSSLYYHLAPSEDRTINGFIANWSVLLSLPQ